jgi:hypothetical protein
MKQKRVDLMAETLSYLMLAFDWDLGLLLGSIGFDI